MTDTEATQDVAWTLMERGKADVGDVIGSGNTERLIEGISLRGLTYLIQEVLDEHYPEDIFPTDDALMMTWLDDHGGETFEPGIKWITLLRHAIKQVAP